MMKPKIYDTINLKLADIKVSDKTDFKGMVCVPCFKSDFNDEGEIKSDFLKDLDKKTDGLINRMTKMNKFTGKEETQLMIPASKDSECLLIGVGEMPTYKEDEYIEDAMPGNEKWRFLGMKTVQSGNGASRDEVSVIFRNIDKNPDTKLSFRILAEGLVRGQYVFNYKMKDEKAKDKPDFTVKNINVFVDSKDKADAEKGVSDGIITGKSANFAKSAVDEPSNQLYPASYVEMIKEFMKGSNCDIEVKDYNWIKEQGMGCLTAVAQGNEGHESEAKFVIIKSKKKSKNGKLALIGKGVTYDTGGYNLKPSGNFIAIMKNDMGGSAAMIAATKAIIDMDIDIELVTVTALTENSVSRSAIKPGDVVKSYSGKTVEILNTDAEGRLTLADAMSYIYEKEKPDYMVDAATLTGACLVSLGLKYAGFMGINIENNKKFEKAARDTGEAFWELPLTKKYRDLFKGKVSDLTNIHADFSRWGGTIGAGLFLKEFIGECKNWLHLDIAGPTYAVSKSYLGEGGLAHSVASLVRYAEEIAKK